MFRLLALLAFIGLAPSLCMAGTGIWVQDDFDDGAIDPIWTVFGTVVEADSVLQAMGVSGQAYVYTESPNLRATSINFRLKVLSGEISYIQVLSALPGFPDIDSVEFNVRPELDDVRVVYRRNGEYLHDVIHDVSVDYGVWYEVDVSLDRDRYSIAVDGALVAAGIGWYDDFVGDRFNRLYLGAFQSVGHFDDLIVLASDLNADLSVTKTCSASQVSIGDTLPYEIRVTNTGPGDATGVELEDKLPPGTSFIGATPDQGTCSTADGILTCELGSIANGETVTVFVDLSLDEIFVGNTAVVRAAQFDNDTANNEASVVTSIACDGTSSSPTPIGTVGAKLLQNHPNPFRPSTTIPFQLDAPGFVELTIYDASGRAVRSLVGKRSDSGEHRVEWNGQDDDGRSVASGTYFYELSFDGETIGTKRAVYLK